jgi:SAM-dependent methyltransferase
MSVFNEQYYLAANPDVAMAIMAGFCKSGRDHYERYGRAEGRPGSPEEEQQSGAVTKGHRREAAPFLEGAGVELGAFDSPCPVSPGARVTYCDLRDVDSSKEVFPETRTLELVEPSVLVDVDRQGLAMFSDGSQDFAIANHVLEHLANPLKCIHELLRIVRPGGHVVLSVPDHRYTVDRGRAVTSFDHVLGEYEAGVTEVDPVHFVDTLALTRPDVLARGVDAIVEELAILKSRREHAHVWDSETFRALVLSSAERFGRTLRVRFEATGEATLCEYFGVFELE